MQLPPETSIHILKHLVDLLSFDVLPLRLVNSLFAEEIPKLLFRSPTRLENDFTLKRWREFPDRFRRLYLRSKIDMHPVTPCVFSFFAHEMLKTQLAYRAHGISPSIHFIDRIVDIGPYLGHDRWDMFDEPRYDTYMTWYLKQLNGPWPYPLVWEPIEETALLVLGMSAIVRDETDFLSWALESGLDMNQVSGRLDMSPISFAAQKASKGMAAFIVNRGYDLSSRRRYGKEYIVLVDATLARNMAALEVWIEHLKGLKDEHLQFNVRRMIHVSVIVRDFETMDFFLPWYEGDVEGLLYNFFMQCVREDRMVQINALLQHKALDRAMWTKKYPKGPIFTVLMNPGYRPMAVLEALLQGGISPDGRYPGLIGTPLQRAVEKDRFDVAEMLIKFGADVNVMCTPHRMRKRSRVPLLVIAARKRNHRMVRLLLDSGADPLSAENDKKHRLYIQILLNGKETEKNAAPKA